MIGTFGLIILYDKKYEAILQEEVHPVVQTLLPVDVLFEDDNAPYILLKLFKICFMNTRMKTNIRFKPLWDILEC